MLGGLAGAKAGLIAIFFGGSSGSSSYDIQTAAIGHRKRKRSSDASDEHFFGSEAIQMDRLVGQYRLIPAD